MESSWGWAEELAESSVHSLSDTSISDVHGVENVDVTPPLRRYLLSQDQAEENDNGRYEQTSVKTCRCDVVVLHPPSAKSSLNEEVEHRSGDTPAEVNVYCGRGNPSSSSKHEREGDVSQEGRRPFTGEEVGDERKGGTNEPVPLQVDVNLTRAKDTSRADGTPDDGGDVEDLSTWARVSVGLIISTDILNAAESPVVNGDLDNGGPEHSYALSSPHCAGRNLHVVTHLEILEEIQGLGHGDVTVTLEHHHGQWATWKHVSDNELGDDVKTNLPVGDGLDHTDRDEEDNWDQHADDECPPCHVSIPVETDNQGQGEEDNVKSEVPPFW